MAKTVNYTPEMTKAIVEAYTANPTKATVESLSKEFGKNVKSIVAKLSREGVYVKPTEVGKKGGVKKADLVTAITKMVPMADNDAESLTKATMNALKAIEAALASEADEADEG